MFISITRLRLRHWWYLPAFFWGSNRSIAQARKAPGFRRGFTLADRKRAFWTLTGWESEGAMRKYRASGAHQEVMGKLPGWCDEAAVVHYQADELPPWTEAWERLKGGRFISVQRPSADQLAKQISAPRTQPLMQRSI
jgi:hypothetical protein